MSKQPEALRLAELLEQIDGLHWQVQDSAAAELRRLHLLNAELLEALKKIAAIEDQMYGNDWEEIEEARVIARVVIARADGKPNGGQAMSRDEVIRLAREAGLQVVNVDGVEEVAEGDWYTLQTTAIERFAGLVAAHERETWRRSASQ